MYFVRRQIKKMNEFKDFINSPIYLWVVMPVIMAYAIAMSSRYSGKEFEKCENLKERFGVWFCIAASTFINYVLIVSMMSLVYLNYKS